MTITVLERARKYLDAIAGAVSGQGGHDQTFSAACALVNGFALSEADALALIHEYNLRCSPPWSDRELAHKISSAIAANHEKPRGHLLGDGHQPAPLAPRITRPVPPAPQPIDATTATANTEKYLRGFRCTADDLRAASPCKIPPGIQPGGAWWHRQSAYLLSQLFEEGERANIVTHAIIENGKARPGDSGITDDQNEWQGRLLEPQPPRPAGAWLRMNPLDGHGVGDVNVTAFRFALVEIDKLTIGLQLPLLARLRLPIAALITSAGKSVHAWVRVDAQDADEYRTAVSGLLALLAPFGVDGKNKNPSRLSRLPGVTRTVGAIGDGMQDLLYLNPHPEQKAIL